MCVGVCVFFNDTFVFALAIKVVLRVFAVTSTRIIVTSHGRTGAEGDVVGKYLHFHGRGVLGVLRELHGVIRRGWVRERRRIRKRQV